MTVNQQEERELHSRSGGLFRETKRQHKVSALVRATWRAAQSCFVCWTASLISADLKPSQIIRRRHKGDDQGKQTQAGEDEDKKGLIQPPRWSKRPRGTVALRASTRCNPLQCVYRVGIVMRRIWRSWRIGLQTVGSRFNLGQQLRRGTLGTIGGEFSLLKEELL